MTSSGCFARIVAAVKTGLRRNEATEDMRKDPAIMKYAALGEGGAQTLAQYVDMLVKLLR